MAGNYLDISEPLLAAQRYRANEMAIDEATRQRDERTNILAARKKAVSGDKEALRELMVMSPQEAKGVVDALKSIQETDKPEQLKQWKEHAQIIGSFAAWADDEEKWNSGLEWLGKQGLDTSNVGEYTPQKRALIIATTGKLLDATTKRETEIFGEYSEIPGQPGLIGQPVAKNGVATGEWKGVREKPDPTSGGMKASESNSIRAGAAGLFGGTYDPMSGTFAGLSKDMTAKVAAISERASELFQKSRGGIDANRAVAQAAREFGIQLPSAQGGRRTPPDGDAPVKGNDPANIRGWLNQK